MKRILIGLAASAAMVSLSTGAIASARSDKPQDSYSWNGRAVILAQASGGTTSGNGPTVTEPAEKAGGKRKTETEVAEPPANPNATDVTGSTGEVDASQSKRKDTSEPTQSGSK